MRRWYATHESNRPGSDWTCVCDDLKTLRGVQNRIIRGAWAPGLWRIYVCDREDWYRATGHYLVGKVFKAPPAPAGQSIPL